MATSDVRSASAKSGWSRIRCNIVGTRKVALTRCSATRRSHSPASNRVCTTAVWPEYRLPSMPSEPPTWKNGTHIMLTAGLASARNGADILPMRMLSCRLEMPTAFGSPVVPLVNRINASRSSSAVDGVSTTAAPLSRSASLNTVGAPASRSRSTYACPATATSAQPALCSSARSSAGVSAGFISAAAAPIRIAPSTVAIDSRLPPSTTATRWPATTPRAVQAGGACPHRRGELAVTDRASIDDERGAGPDRRPRPRRGWCPCSCGAQFMR